MRWLWSAALAWSLTALAGDPAVPKEATRAGAEYFVQRAGASWVYQLEKGRGRVSIGALVDWKAQVAFSLGKRTGASLWYAREGVWLERSSARGPSEAVVLPAQLARGTRWAAPASIERGGEKPAVFEVMALDATVELPQGQMDGCLAVLETSADGSDPWTHYYAPNVGKVAVRSPSGWVLRLIEFRGRAGHGE